MTVKKILPRVFLDMEIGGNPGKYTDVLEAMQILV